MLKANKVLISWQDVVFIKWVLLKCQLQRFVYLLSFLSQALKYTSSTFSRNKEEQKEEDGLTEDHHNSNSASKWLHLREQEFFRQNKRHPRHVISQDQERDVKQGMRGEF